MKKLLSILLTFVMVFSFVGMNASAETDDSQTPVSGTGTITISGTGEGSVYSIYKILDLISYDKTSGRYSYKTNSEWAGFFETADALQYVSVDADGYVNWTNADTAQVDAPEFAKKALAWASQHTGSVVPEASVTSTGDTVTFNNLELGYYLIDSTVGVLCGLTTTNNTASITAKNVPPTVHLYVKEDYSGTWSETNVADSNEIIKFKCDIMVQNGAQNYVLHDEFGSGFTFITDIDQIKVYLDGTEVINENNSNYTLNTNPTANSCGFEVVFNPVFCGSLTTGSVLSVEYKAKLNGGADGSGLVVAGDGNINTVRVSYGERMENSNTVNGYTMTNPDTTVTYTYGVDIVKTDGQNQLIDGAKFRLYDSLTGGNEIKLTYGNNIYRVDKEKAGDGAEIVVLSNDVVIDGVTKYKKGTVRIEGLDNGTYYLEETVAPLGYNKILNRRMITISESNHDATFSNGQYSTGSGIQVVNQAGTMLPQTGSMGTTAFITFGSIVALATGVLLVTKKRMSMIDD